MGTCPYQGIWLAPFFILLLVMAICGAQGRVWKISHTWITCIAKSKTGSKEKNQSHNQIKMSTCMNVVDKMETPLCMILLSLFFKDMAISFLSLSLFFGRTSLACHLFFSLTVGHASLACHLSFLAHCGSCFFGMPSFLSFFHFIFLEIAHVSFCNKN